MDLVECLVAALDVYDVEELEGGHQSRVFRVTDRSGLPVVAKVLDGPMADRGELDARLDVTAALADLDPRVCRPLLRDGRRVTEIASPDGRHQYYAVCFELALGAEPDPASTDDATRMGAALATLHVSMSRLPATSLPVVRARSSTGTPPSARSLPRRFWNASSTCASEPSAPGSMISTTHRSGSAPLPKLGRQPSDPSWPAIDG